MCGRYSIYEIVELTKFFNAPAPEEFKPVYNAAPSMNLPILTSEDHSKFVNARWGLIPHWAKDEKFGLTTNNARIETIKEKPLFKQAFEKTRCLIPTNGFFEWKTTGKIKTPNYITTDNMMIFAGIYNHWQDKLTYSVITTESVGEMRDVHDRMPVVLPKEEALEYLNTGEILNPIHNFKIYKVSPKVNNSRYQNKDVLNPLTTLSGF